MKYFVFLSKLNETFVMNDEKVVLKMIFLVIFTSNRMRKTEKKQAYCLEILQFRQEKKTHQRGFFFFYAELFTEVFLLEKK